MTAHEEERRRVSSELHDDLNQKVAALSIAVSTIKNQLASTRSEGSSRSWTCSRDVASKSQTAYAGSHIELHPAVLEHMGLGAALKAHVAELSHLEGIRIALNVPDCLEAIPKDVRPSVCIELLRSLCATSSSTQE